MKKILIDFDGTIVDVWQRFYKVFVASSKTNKTIDFNKYKELKLKFEDDYLIAKYLGIELPADYKLQKRQLLEDMQYLSFDKLLISKDRLINFIISKNAVIFTKRRSIDNFYKELDMLGLSGISNRCMVLSPNKKISKYEYWTNHTGENVLIIGDSIEEYDFSKNNQNIIILVKTGLRNVDGFLTKDNVLIIENIEDGIDNIEESLCNLEI